MEVYTQKLDFSGFFRKKAQSDAVKWFYGTKMPIRANFKSLGLFLLITHFGARQDHFDAPIASFLRKSAKNLNFERFSPYPVLRDFFFSDVKQAQLFLFKHIEQLLHCYGDHTEHQMAKDFPMPLHSDMASAVIVFQIRIPAFNC